MSEFGIVGVGYVGLALATSLLAAGKSIVGVEKSEARISRIENSAFDGTSEDKSTILSGLETGKFHLTSDYDELKSVDCIIICLPTPTDENHEPDYSILQEACQRIVEGLDHGQMVILTSTSFIGTTREFLVNPIEAKGLSIGNDVFVAFSPERVDPGNTKYRHEAVPRIVAGATKVCLKKAIEKLSYATNEIHPATSLEAAEMTKLVENTFRAVNIAWINEMENLANAQGLDIQEVVDLASTKPYGFMKFTAGPGAGGHCIPADPHYLLRNSPSELAPLTTQSMASLHHRPVEIAERALETLGGNSAEANVLVWGVSYKPNVSDVRESPAIRMISTMSKQVKQVAYHDPFVAELEVNGTQYNSIDPKNFSDYDLVVLHTIHDEGLPVELTKSNVRVFDATFKTPYRLNVLSK